jgi:hypothetical protein
MTGSVAANEWPTVSEADRAVCINTPTKMMGGLPGNAVGILSVTVEDATELAGLGRFEPGSPCRHEPHDGYTYPGGA